MYPNGYGAFSFIKLVKGSYSMTITAVGYQPKTLGFTLNSDTTMSLALVAPVSVEKQNTSLTKKTNSSGRVLSYNSRNKLLFIRINEVQNVQISVSYLNGKVLSELSGIHSLPVGTHVIDFASLPQINGPVIFNVVGEQFSESSVLSITK